MQLDMFSLLYEPYKITKPLRLIELFAGYGSQALGFKYLGVNYEHHFVCEFDKYAIDTYNKIHNTNFETTDIRDVHASDINITDPDKYTYLMTYSFPCTDLSLAGKRAGMSKGSGTRSGLLWEVERLIEEMGEIKPDILLMENVPQVLTADGWREWQTFLENKGYSNFCTIMNAKNYGIPQNRERCFMVSILNKDVSYTFPKGFELKYRLKDFLQPEDEVADKYYLSDKHIEKLKFECKELEDEVKQIGTIEKECL